MAGLLMPTNVTSIFALICNFISGDRILMLFDEDDDVETYL